MRIDRTRSHDHHGSQSICSHQRLDRIWMWIDQPSKSSKSNYVPFFNARIEEQAFTCTIARKGSLETWVRFVSDTEKIWSQQHLPAALLPTFIVSTKHIRHSVCEYSSVLTRRTCNALRKHGNDLEQNIARLDIFDWYWSGGKVAVYAEYIFLDIISVCRMRWCLF